MQGDQSTSSQNKKNGHSVIPEAKVTDVPYISESYASNDFMNDILVQIKRISLDVMNVQTDVQNVNTCLITTSHFSNTHVKQADTGVIVQINWDYIDNI